jgi:hypothetical protein
MDLTHHLETARLYHEMIREGRFILHNPYLLAGQQYTFTYGIPFYAVAGLLWFVFDRFTIDLIMCLITLLSFAIIRRMIHNLGYQAMALVMLWGFVIPDSYIAYCANGCLWLTAYLYGNGKRSYQVPLALACLTHPFSVIVGFYYAYRERRLLILIGMFLVYYLIISFMFVSQGHMVLPNIINTLVARVAIALVPVLLQEDMHKKIIKAAGVALVGLVCLSNAVLFALTEPMQVRGYYEGYQRLFNAFPHISGTMRVVDYDYLPSAYYFHEKGLTITTGSFFEGWILQTRSTWNDEREYQQYLDDHHIDYVLVCKACGAVFPGAHPSEKAILSSRYPAVWENEYYLLYRVQGKEAAL